MTTYNAELTSPPPASFDNKPDYGGGSALNDGLEAWISTNDRLPDLDVNVLVILSSGVTVASRFDDGEGWLWAVANYIGCDLHSAETECDDEYLPLFWMPIPEAPNAELTGRGPKDLNNKTVL